MTATNIQLTKEETINRLLNGKLAVSHWNLASMWFFAKALQAEY